MWGETLKKIDHSSTPQSAASLWGADTGSLKLINDGINVVYRFTTKEKGRYLRLTHSLIRTEIDLASSLDFQRHLFENGAPVCKPLISNSNRKIEEIKQGQLMFLATAVEEVRGYIMHFDERDPSIYRNWGAALAKLHQVAKTYKPDPKFQFKTWQDLWSETSAYLKGEESIIIEEYKKVDAWFHKLPAFHEDFGLTHGDHRTGNVLYDKKNTYFIDFDEPVYHWFIADIAKPFLELQKRPKSFLQKKFAKFIAGYQSVTPLSPDLLSNIHWFARMKSLDIYLWCKNQWHEESMDGISREQWLKDLRQLVLNPVFLV